MLELQSRIVAEVRLDYLFLTQDIKNRESGKSGFWDYTGFGGFGGFGRFRGFRGLARSGVSRGGSQFRPDLGIWPDLPNLGFSRGPESGVSGVQNRGFPGSQIRGKSTHSATMVSVVSSSWDPDFDEDLEILTKSGVPGQKNLGPGRVEIWGFRGPKSGVSGVRNLGFSGFWQISQISGFWPDFPDFRVLARFRDFGYPGA